MSVDDIWLFNCPGKRDAEEAIEKASSAKKQKREVKEVVPQKDIKKPKKFLQEVPSKKKPESSSEDETSSESEEEVCYHCTSRFSYNRARE